MQLYQISFIYSKKQCYISKIKNLESAHYFISSNSSTKFKIQKKYRNLYAARWNLTLAMYKSKSTASNFVALNKISAYPSSTRPIYLSWIKKYKVIKKQTCVEQMKYAIDLSQKKRERAKELLEKVIYLRILNFKFLSCNLTKLQVHKQKMLYHF